MLLLVVLMSGPTLRHFSLLITCGMFCNRDIFPVCIEPFAYRLGGSEATLLCEWEPLPCVGDAL